MKTATHAIEELAERLYPGSRVVRAHPFGVDEGISDAATSKGVGYGRLVRVTIADPSGTQREFVIHAAGSDQFGHDRRADRAGEMLLAYDTFSMVPSHVKALDVGIIAADNSLRSLATGGEFYLVTEYSPGHLYADDMRRIAIDGRATARDIERARLLAKYLADLHSERIDDELRYVRAIRDLVGHGEGIFGLIDSFAGDTPGASAERLKSLEAQCVDWRWRLRGYGRRLTRTHGDFHPFNIVFDDQGELALLDASRGCRGDAADDVTCLSVNYLFFALEHPGSWQQGTGPLWTAFWDEYLTRSGDSEVLSIAPPFFAWRSLVLANPVWYPAVGERERDVILTLAETTLEAGRLDLAGIDAVMS